MIRFYGGMGDDYLGGGAGDDIIYLEGDDTHWNSYRNQQYITLGQYNDVEFSWARGKAEAVVIALSLLKIIQGMHQKGY